MTIKSDLSSSTPVDPAATSRREHRLAVNASWLLRLRWVAIVGQLFTIAAAHYLLPIDVPLLPLLTIVAITALTNLLLTWTTRWLRVGEEHDSGTERWLAGVMVFDLLMLTALLMFSGGPHNPFALFYLVNLALAAVLLPRPWSWTIGLIGVLCFCSLYIWYHPIPQLQPRAVADSTTLWGRFSLDRLAFLLALVTCAAVIVYFVTRVTAELQLRERELREAELQRARTQRLEALGTLAAGAGHELASPLATIAVVTRELERHLEGTNAPQTVLEDVQLIRTELARCRAILNRMSTDAGQVAGDELRRLRLDEVASATLQGLPYRDQIQVELRPGDASQCVFAPRQALAQAIRAVLQNAHDASPPGIPIHFLLSRNGDDVFFEVRDQGAGMPPDVIARAGEPFFTTKEPGQGTGLGLFLTRSVIQRLGGELAFDSRPKHGTAVRITLRRCP